MKPPTFCDPTFPPTVCWSDGRKWEVRGEWTCGTADEPTDPHCFGAFELRFLPEPGLVALFAGIMLLAWLAYRYPRE